jgi:voltage-gated potassium channel Kch
VYDVFEAGEFIPSSTHSVSFAVNPPSKKVESLHKVEVLNGKETFGNTVSINVKAEAKIVTKLKEISPKFADQYNAKLRISKIR